MHCNLIIMQLHSQHAWQDDVHGANGCMEFKSQRNVL
jgi:hypothetical protein